MAEATFAPAAHYPPAPLMGKPPTTQGEGKAVPPDEVPPPDPAEHPETLYVYVGAGETQGPRPHMEDRTCVTKSFALIAHDGIPRDDGIDRTLAAVFDGHGTALAAELAAEQLPTILAQESGLAGSTGNPWLPEANRYDERKGVWKAMQGAFLRLEEEVVAALAAARMSGGCTAVVGLRMGQMLYVANAGDSRAVLCRSGRALRLSHDHLPTEPGEEFRIEAAGGRVDEDEGTIVTPAVPQHVNISRALGDLALKSPAPLLDWHPEVAAVQLTPDDGFVVLMSDGVSDVMSDQQVVDFVVERLTSSPTWREGAEGDGTARDAAAALAEAAAAAGTQDNASAVVMLLQWGPPHHE